MALADGIHLAHISTTLDVPMAYTDMLAEEPRIQRKESQWNRSFYSCNNQLDEFHEQQQQLTGTMIICGWLFLLSGIWVWFGCDGRWLCAFVLWFCVVALLRLSRRLLFSAFFSRQYLSYRFRFLCALVNRTSFDLAATLSSSRAGSLKYGLFLLDWFGTILINELIFYSNKSSC